MTNLSLLLLALVLANVPWLTSRLFFVFPLKQSSKSVAWCLLELVVFYFLLGLLARYAEQATMGQVSPQKWEFYAITACMFLVLAFPGFIYRFFWKK
jgi:Na+(H+)/acetate symporter ActP